METRACLLGHTSGMMDMPNGTTKSVKRRGLAFGNSRLIPK
jgi:hypothetical protein